MRNHQDLMDDAYKLWRTQFPEQGYDYFFNELTPLLRKAVALGNLNYQVGNGGFFQWADNGYQEATRGTLRAIQSELTRTGLATKFPELERALELALSFNYRTSRTAEDRMCDEFYALNNLENEMEQYLREIRR